MRACDACGAESDRADVTLRSAPHGQRICRHGCGTARQVELVRLVAVPVTTTWI